MAAGRARPARLLAQIGEMLGYEIRGLACRMPAIAVLGRSPQGSPRMAAHPDGDRRLLHRLGHKLDAGEAVIPCRDTPGSRSVQSILKMSSHSSVMAPRAAYGTPSVSNSFSSQPTPTHKSCVRDSAHPARRTFWPARRGCIGHNNDRTAQLDGAGCWRPGSPTASAFPERARRRGWRTPRSRCRVIAWCRGGQHDVVTGKHRLEPQLLGALGKTTQSFRVGTAGCAKADLHGRAS